ncbi:FAD-dependent oxidoreductase [Pseudolysobacter antarcticus]|uniref:FAD-dependent oxidoreductase n=1 Tax=Pseudolysobacter antarcticus TaxID=2511995 RepID=A0A411HH98_9GAMM|nr:FAD-dependent oxidoreductase [Pseudolysobacter antarcticus]QBB69851.1 FAD-dependent oxidoreductase [Pseudolysobacter antarcticus]
MRIAVVGSGISGLASAWLLSREHDVVLFEAGDYLGGHTHTHAIEIVDKTYAVDTGFIVFNPPHYPLLQKMFAELAVESQPTTMSFAVRDERSGLEYNANNLDTLFCQRRNLVSPRFLGMVRDILRFYREAPTLLALDAPDSTIGDYLGERSYGTAFRDLHLVPMASALWSSPPDQIMKFPVKYLVQFMANHQMLQVSNRPQWRVVKGGSQSYVRAMTANWKVQARTNCAVTAIRRDSEGVQIDSSAGIERFDQVVLACHSDQALKLLADASEREQSILGAMPYQFNETVLHTDERMLPRRRKAWAAWNATIPQRADDNCTVTYCMSLLQSLHAPVTFCTTLNRTAQIDPDKILRRMSYQHPLYSHASVAAQTRKAEIQGSNRTWFCGAYWGWGFHEDGMRSAVDVINALGIHWS